MMGFKKDCKNKNCEDCQDFSCEHHSFNNKKCEKCGTFTRVSDLTCGECLDCWEVLTDETEL